MPQLEPVVVESVEVADDVLVCTAHTREAPVACPGCGAVADWEHSRYVRHVADEAVGGRPVRIDLSVRRLYCENPQCVKVTFVEQVDGLTVRYQRRTPGLQAMVVAVVTVLAGTAGARLLHWLHQSLSWAALLGCLMRLPDPPVPPVRVVAVDDFALRRARRYGTLMVDVESRLPLDAWDTREGEPVTDWLRAHPQVHTACRDGSAVYRGAITAASERIVHVSDRFHLWQGLGRNVYEIIAAHRGCLPDPAAPTTAPRRLGGRAAARARRNHAEVHRLLEQGMALRAIARHLDLDRNVVRRIARAATWQQAAPTWPQRVGILTPYQGHLHRRWNQGQHNIAALFRKLAARGFGGSEATVRLYVTDHRETLDEGLPPPAPARSAFEVSRLLMSRPGHLAEDQRVFVKDLLQRCPELHTTHQLIRAFAAVFDKRRPALLDDWIRRARACGIPQLRSFAAGLLDDLDAVTAAATLPYSSGVAEGRITDLKLIKRQMAGHAGIRLLRKRVPLMAHARRTPPPDVTDDPWTINAHENLV
ncbi:ISL3 family transposase [Streptomyces sp. ODS28]|uniref:ISL3 family transposase n=1 Tax=Streptomyces sp. ODS28 TaxID=3136688 RepID=UPI0031EA8DEE